MSYRAWEVAESFGLESLRLVEREDEPLLPGQVRVKMRAASLNFRDLLMVKGHYDPRQQLPLIPLSDGAGEVVELGPGVTRFALGDRVAAACAPTWIAGEPTRERIRTTLGGPLDGTLASERVFSAEGLVPIPAHLDFGEAATLPCAALTAWSSLVTYGGAKAGDVVLVQGTGGVSIFALQLGVALGCRVIVTSSSNEKLARAKELGAAATINYREDESWGKTAAKLTAEGVDHVIEVGGAKTLDQSLRAVRSGGVISLVGILSGNETPLPLTKILMRQVRVQGILVGHRDGFESMNKAIEANGLRPVIDRRFSFAEAPAAFAHLASGKHFGKVVIEL